MPAAKKQIPGAGTSAPVLPSLHPNYLVKVRGSLFHTQGGLVIDKPGRACATAQGNPFSNLYAGGGACRGISGPADWGYLSGNGLLTAVTLGRLAGECATIRR